MIDLGTPRRHFAGAECDSSLAQIPLNLHCERVHATENAPRDPFSVLERRHGLAEIVERCGEVVTERYRVSRPQPGLGLKNPIFFNSQNAPRDANALQTPRRRIMILTNCAACAAALAHNAPR